MTRPSARFNGPGHRLEVDYVFAPGWSMSAPATFTLQSLALHPTAAERAAARDRVRQLVLAVVRERGEVYSAELADALGCSCGHAKSLLIGLELRGFLQSEHRQTTVSGHGRRYYWLRETASAVGGMR